MRIDNESLKFFVIPETLRSCCRRSGYALGKSVFVHLWLRSRADIVRDAATGLEVAKFIEDAAGAFHKGLDTLI
jgi:hypothetical protein